MRCGRHASSRSRGRGSAARLLFFAATLLLSAAWSCSPAPPATPAPPAAAGTSEDPPAASAPAFFTAEQAAEGRRIFTTVCAVCHGRNEFVGPIFALTWMKEPVGHLFEHISTAMPQDDPGSLAPREYAAVVAYMLQLNGRTPGERELPADAEALARLTW